MLQGGLYGNSPIPVRSGDRTHYRPSGSPIVFGFRVARTMPAASMQARMFDRRKL